MVKEIEVTFETITPLWTGDAWGENSQIRPSSILGALRFWFEVLCYFSGRCGERDFNGEKRRFEKEVDKNRFEKCIKRKVMEENGELNLQTKIKCLQEQNIPLPAIIFGATNWRGLVEVEGIDFEKSNFKSERRGRILPNKNFFWSSPYYEGRFTITFALPSEIVEGFFYPLLAFMNNYGFWGGKWNIGYGKLKAEIEGVDLNNLTSLSIGGEEIVPRIAWFRKNSEFCKREFEEEELKKGVKHIISPSIIYIPFNFNPSVREVKEGIKQLLTEKVKLRNCLRRRNNRNFWTSVRHKLMGERGEGSKIIPFIEKVDNGKYTGGFLSIAGLLHLDKDFMRRLNRERT